jgi:C1A family cysteine protease
MMTKSRSHIGSWMPRIALCLVVGLLVAGLAPGGVRGVAQEPEIQKAPMGLAIVAPHPPGTGYFLPQMDLSHLTGEALPRGGMPQALPDVFDWRASGQVTSIKDQGACGSCYAFGYLGSFESTLMIDGAGTWDLSENHAKECNWSELNGYGGSCDGGNFFMVANLYSQAGSVQESCDPYVPSDVACNAGCPYQQTVLDWRLISGGDVPNVEVLKQYIYDHGPVATALYADSLQGFNASYDGSTTLNYTSPPGYVNHGVVIVGWSNSLPPVPGSSTPAEGWIVKNSWGAGWGDDGYFYMTYGTGNIGYTSSFVHAWQAYDSDGHIWYYDEDGWNGAVGWGGANTTSWGLAKYIPDSNTNVTRIEFWTSDATTDVDVYLYDGFDGTSTTNLLASKLDNVFAEAGYHSVALDSPVRVTSGNDIIAVVKFTNSSYGYPISVDGNGPFETARTYASLSGGSGTWTDLSTLDCDATIRLRTSGGAPAMDYAVYLPLTVVIPPPAPSGPNAGFWQSSGGADEFYVTSDQAYVDDFAIYVNVLGCGSYKITHALLEPIVSDHFSFSGAFYGNGTFSSSTSCSGTTGLVNFYISGCGYVSGGPWSYTATWQGATQPASGAGAVSVVEKVDENAVKSFLTARMDSQ